MPENPPRPCPTCRKPLEERDFGDLVLDFCREHGIWFDTGEFDEVRRKAVSRGDLHLQRRKRRARRGGYREGFEVGQQIMSRTRRRARRRLMTRRRKRMETAPALEAPEADHGPRPCPCCGETMVVETWRDFFKATPDVVVDLCPEHGLWLDHSEMEILLERARFDARREGRTKVRRANQDGFEEGMAAATLRRTNRWPFR